MENSAQIIRTISQLADLSGIIMLCQSRYMENTADFRKYNKVRLDIYGAAALWANDIYTRYNDKNSAATKESVYKTISSAVNSYESLAEHDADLAMLASKLEMLDGLKLLLLQYVENNDEIIMGFRTSATAAADMSYLFGGLVEGAVNG